MNGIERLEALEDLRTLKARYFLHLDRQDWARWRDVFMPDATIDVSSQFPDAPDPAAFVHTGIDAIVAMVSGSLVGVVTAHHGHTPVLTIESADAASGVWTMEDNLFLPDGGRMLGYGWYEERYARRDGEWRIAFSKLVRSKLVYTPAAS